MIKFKNEAHEKFYMDHSHLHIDVYHKSLIYALGLLEETRNNFDKLFDAKKSVIIPAALESGWQTSGTLRTCRLAFNLWNGYCGNNRPGDSASNYNVDALFCASLAPWYWEAVKVRYPEYADDNWDEMFFLQTQPQ
jgi:hypothetical protein